MSRRVLVLGAAGFVGRNVCEMLDGHPSIAVLLRHVRNSEEQAALGAAGDDAAVLDLIEAGADGVVDLLASTGPDVVINCTGATVGDEALLHAANVTVVEHLVAAMRGNHAVHLVHLGSAAEYGLTSGARAVRESDAAHPANDYGWSKLRATGCVMAAAATGAITATVLRVFNPVGKYAPSQTLAGHAADELVAAMRHGSDELHLGSLEGARDYVDVRDVALAAIMAGSTPLSSGQVFNVARGEATRSRALVSHLCVAAGFEGRVVESEPGSVRSEGLAWQEADLAAIHTALPWRAHFSVADAAQALWASRREVCAH